jgi:hypothetical protein
MAASGGGSAPPRAIQLVRSATESAPQPLNPDGVFNERLETEVVIAPKKARLGRDHWEVSDIDGAYRHTSASLVQQALLTSATGHVWTTPALQEESDVRLAVGCKSCVRPVCAAHDRWP